MHMEFLHALLSTVQGNKSLLLVPLLVIVGILLLILGLLFWPALFKNSAKPKNRGGAPVTPRGGAIARTGAQAAPVQVAPIAQPQADEGVESTVQAAEVAPLPEQVQPVFVAAEEIYPLQEIAEDALPLQQVQEDDVPVQQIQEDDLLMQQIPQDEEALEDEDLPARQVQEPIRLRIHPPKLPTIESFAPVQQIAQDDFIVQENDLPQEAEPQITNDIPAPVLQPAHLQPQDFPAVQARLQPPEIKPQTQPAPQPAAMPAHHLRRRSTINPQPSVVTREEQYVLQSAPYSLNALENVPLQPVSPEQQGVYVSILHPPAAARYLSPTSVAGMRPQSGQIQSQNVFLPSKPLTFDKLREEEESRMEAERLAAEIWAEEQRRLALQQEEQRQEEERQAALRRYEEQEQRRIAQEWAAAQEWAEAELYEEGQRLIEEERKAEAERIAEAKRIEDERIAEEQRLEAERIAEEQRLEAERIAEEQRLEAERIEAERIESIRIEAIRKAAEEEAAHAEFHLRASIREPYTPPSRANRPYYDILLNSAMDIGQRDVQQDAVYTNTYLDRYGSVAILCDGMGPAAEGKEASILAIHTILATLRDSVAANNILISALGEANTVVSNYAHEQNLFGKVGTTAIAAWIDFDRVLRYSAVGDSHLYVIRNQDIRQINRDHTYYADLLNYVQQGRITAEEAENHPHKGHLTSFIGINRLRRISYNLTGFQLLPGDLVLLCSDGLYKSIPEEYILEIVRHGNEDVASDLVRAAIRKEAPFQDNVSVITMLYRADNEEEYEQ